MCIQHPQALFSLSDTLSLEGKALCEVVFDSLLCSYIDNSMFQLSPNKETGIDDCRHVDENG